jgi:hypothetical protein
MGFCGFKTCFQSQLVPLRREEGVVAAGVEGRARWGCTRCIQLAHSLKAPGFNPCACKVKKLVFKIWVFKFNLHRYGAGSGTAG